MQYVVVPTRRSTAEAFQILISHTFGDAGSPYLVGVVSISNNDLDSAWNVAEQTFQFHFYFKISEAIKHMLRGTSHAVNHLFNATFAEERLEIKSLALTAENVTSKAYEVSKSNPQHTLCPTYCTWILIISLSFCLGHRWDQIQSITICPILNELCGNFRRCFLPNNSCVHFTR